MTTSRPSICGCCPAGCGFRVELDGDQVVGVLGDAEYPASHGYLCQKGHRLAWFHQRPNRLDLRLLGGHPTTWDERLDDRPLRLLCSRITATQNPNDYLRSSGSPSGRPSPCARTTRRCSASPTVIQWKWRAAPAPCAAWPASTPRARGVVSMVHGSNTKNVTRLTSPVDRVDPLTGEPVMTAVPVSVRRREFQEVDA